MKLNLITFEIKVQEVERSVFLELNDRKKRNPISDIPWQTREFVGFLMENSIS